MLTAVTRWTGQLKAQISHQGGAAHREAWEAAGRVSARMTMLLWFNSVCVFHPKKKGAQRVGVVWSFLSRMLVYPFPASVEITSCSFFLSGLFVCIRAASYFFRHFVLFPQRVCPHKMLTQLNIVARTHSQTCACPHKAKNEAILGSDSWLLDESVQAHTYSRHVIHNAHIKKAPSGDPVNQWRLSKANGSSGWSVWQKVLPFSPHKLLLFILELDQMFGRSSPELFGQIRDEILVFPKNMFKTNI